MGLSFRKSIKVGKLFNVSVGKTGVGLSAGVKGARVSVNKNGIGGSIGANGIRYSKRKSFKAMQRDSNNLGSISQEHINSTPVGNLSYTRHITLLIAGFICLFIGFLFPPLMFIAIILLFSGIVCMLKNWKRINQEYKNRKTK